VSIWTTDEAGRVLDSRSFTLSCRASVTLAGRVLADNVPIARGREELDSSLRVPERVTLTVPRTTDGVDWGDDAFDAPLAPYGQRIHVRLGVGSGAGTTEYLDRGEFLIQDVDLDGEEVTVTAVGLLALIDEARLVAPFAPKATIAATLRGLVEPALTVSISAALTNRAVPADLNMDEDRLQAVYDLLDAWGAHAYVDNAGVLQVVPATAYGNVSPLLMEQSDVVDQAFGYPRASVTQVSSGASRSNIVNTVVARGTAPDGGQVQGSAYTSLPPAGYPGPFNALPVPEFFYSPLLTTNAQCLTAARSILARKAPINARSWDVEAVPDPRMQLDDNIGFTPDRGTTGGVAARVVQLGMPYTAGSGVMTVRLQEVSA